MRGSWLRQTALTNNIANADTPGLPARRKSTSSRRCRARSAGGELAGQVAVPTETPPDRSRAPTAPRVSIDQESAQAGRKRPRLPGADAGRRHPQRHHPLGDRDPLMGLFDAIGIAGTRPHRASASAWTSRPRTSPTPTRRKARTASPTSARRSSLAQIGAARLRRRALGRAAGRRRAQRRRAASQVDGDRQPTAPRPAGLRPRQPRSRRAGLREDAERQHGHRNDRPDLRAAVLPVRRHRDADREVDVHLDAGAAQMIVPADRRPRGHARQRRRRSAARRPAQRRLAGAGAEGGLAQAARAPKAPRRPAAARRASAARSPKRSPRWRGARRAPTRASQALATGTVERPRGRGRDRRGRRARRCSSPRRSARRRPKPPRRSSRRRSDRCPSPSSRPGSPRADG